MSDIPPTTLTIPESAIAIDSYEPCNVTGHFCDLFSGIHISAGKVALKRLRVSSRGSVDQQQKVRQRPRAFGMAIDLPDSSIFWPKLTPGAGFTTRMSYHSWAFTRLVAIRTWSLRSLRTERWWTSSRPSQTPIGSNW